MAVLRPVAAAMSRRLTPFMAATALALGLGLATPALALDDGQENLFDSMLGIIGMGPDKDNPTIEYRERPPLVVPPKLELPQPQASIGERNPAWPQDYDIVKRQKNDAQRRVRREPGAPMTAAEMRADRSAAPARDPVAEDQARRCNDAYGPSCDPTKLWNSLKTSKATAADILDPAAPTQREYLTQPPSAYRKPSKVIKATAGPVERDNYYDNINDPAALAREEARRKAASE